MSQTKKRSILPIFVALCAIVISILLYPQPQFNHNTALLASSYIARSLSTTLSTRRESNGESDVNDQPLKGVVVVITGGSSGIGLSATKMLHKLGATMVVIGRNSTKLSILQSELQKLAGRNYHKNDKSNVESRMVPIQANLNDMESVSRAADEVSFKFKHIDFLINNAGVHPMNLKSFVSAQGYDQTFTVNYLSHFLLTEKLLPKLEKSRYEPRIIQISSRFHWQTNGRELIPTVSDVENSPSLIPPMASRGDLSSLPHRIIRGYGNSKLAQVLHGRKLIRMLESKKSPVKVLSVCPSWVGSEMTGRFGHFFAFPADDVGISQIMNAMFQPDLGGPRQPDFVVNSGFLHNPYHGFLSMILLKLDLVPGMRDLYIHALAYGVLLPFQKFTYGDFILEESSPESYDVAIQDSLYTWSKHEIKRWI